MPFFRPDSMILMSFILDTAVFLGVERPLPPAKQNEARSPVCPLEVNRSELNAKNWS